MWNRMDILKIEYYRHRFEGRAEKAANGMHKLARTAHFHEPGVMRGGLGGVRERQLKKGPEQRKLVLQSGANLSSHKRLWGRRLVPFFFALFWGAVMK